ncbi:MAG: LruC domain-containing protein, partial [Algicola sp.]|nr:LruC domain-containing protein [Algicola sp.]
MNYCKLLFLLMGLTTFVSVADPTTQSTIQNGDGSYTYTQKITVDSTSPHYVAPSGYGFDEYSWFDEDYGWQHSFDLFNQSNYGNYQIQNATLLIRGWDVDSEPFHGETGEYDGLSVDGQALDPGLLQGTNNTWSETEFDVPLSSISDDGLINVYLNIDMNHNQRHWATTLDYSLLSITYIETSNLPPYQAQLSFVPSEGVSVFDDLVVSATGPTPADPEGNAVTYQYRWYVDVGQGFFVDDTFAGKAEHTGNTVPASQTANGERWRVTVTPVDSNGLVAPATTVTWSTIGDSDNDGVMDASDAFPTDPLSAFLSR